MRIAGCRNIALWLVHHDIDLFLAFEPLAVESDIIGVNVDLGSEFCYNLTVYGNDSCKDEVVGLSSRAYTRIRDVLVESDFLLDRNIDHVVVGISFDVTLVLLADHLVDSALLFITEIVEILLIEALLCTESASLSAVERLSPVIAAGRWPSLTAAV